MEKCEVEPARGGGGPDTGAVGVADQEVESRSLRGPRPCAISHWCQRRDQGRVLGGVDRPHAPQMRREMTVLEEETHCLLREGRSEAVELRAQVGNRLDEGRGHDEISEAERDEHRLAQGAQVEHAGVRAQGVERGEWPAFVTELAVVVVLENPRAAPACPLEKREAAVEIEGDAARILVRGRDVDEPGTG